MVPRKLKPQPGLAVGSDITELPGHKLTCPGAHTKKPPGGKFNPTAKEQETWNFLQDQKYCLTVLFPFPVDTLQTEAG